MDTQLHSFMDIFDTSFDVSGKKIRLSKISIPIIQRDYAQGRLDPEASRVRERFLESLYQAVTGQPITLDFIYGDINDEGVMTPLDGQQRLTTLFLLHWYAAKKEKILEEDCEFLSKFSYETRYSARDFCTELWRFDPAFTDRISSEIIDQTWFPLDWKKDPTISSMLVMLDSIQARFKDVPDLWGHLRDGAVTFYFLPIRDMGLTDELYIKMNSRGKPLTQFEHFKAELERNIRAVDGALADRIAAKIDQDWTDLLWKYRGTGGESDDLIDDEFLRYFRFVCDVICYREGQSPQGKRNDEFSLLNRYFSQQCPAFLSNLRTLEELFDCWCDIPDFESPSKFLDAVMSFQHTPGKIMVDGSRYGIDIFRDCLSFYLDKRRFPLNRFVLLYAVTVYLRHIKSNGAADLWAFSCRLRIVNNLIQNSTDEVSDRADRNRIPAILRQVDAIILTGQIDDTIENNFNVNQLQEEKEKSAFLQACPEKEEALFALEDHPRLNGQISIIGIDHLDHDSRFVSLFKCDLDQIDCALMAFGDYGQRERNGWRYQYASSKNQSAWDELFHKSANSGFEKTNEILLLLLESNTEFSDEILVSIADRYIEECERNSIYPWRYYYIKYPVFRPGSFGKLSNNNASITPYLFSVMQTRQQWSENTYMPYLKAVDDQHLSRDDMGQRLVYGDRYIVCENAAFVVKSTSDDTVLERIGINQDSSGIDTEDRIKKLADYLRSAQFSV